MTTYRIDIARRAAKALRKMPAHVRTRLADAIDALADEPRPHGLKTLDASKKLYRIRVGGYRVIYQVRDQQLVVLVVRVADRKEVYRRLDDLVKRLDPLDG